MTAVATLPDVDLEALAGEPLPPCEFLLSWSFPRMGIRGPDIVCGKPAIGIARTWCAGCGARRRSTCGPCIREFVELAPILCGACNSHDLVLVGMS